MNGAIVFLVIGAVLRFSAAGMRLGDRRFPLQALGWLMGTTAAWMAANAVGAWSPWWSALAIALLGFLGSLQLNPRPLWIAADALSVTITGFLSIPPVPFVSLCGAIVATVVFGFITDCVLERSPHQILTGIVVSSVGLPLVAGLAIAVVRPGLARNVLIDDADGLCGEDVGSLGTVLRRSELLFLGLTPVHQGKRIELESGAIGRLERPSGSGPFPGAVFFHGNDRDASMQSSAVVVRRALLEAGFVVLTVDHPGYGQSPAPSPEADVAAWDPFPTALAAVDGLRSRPEVGEVFALGHSMGAEQVLRLLSAQSEIAAAALFGAALGDDEVRFEKYWYERFHTERRLRERIPPERYLEIADRFHVTGPRFVASLPADHPEVLFVRFGCEWANIAANRDALYHAIPGRKTTWDFVDSTHYFSSYGAMGLVIGDVRVTRALASRLRLLAADAETALGPHGESLGAVCASASDQCSTELRARYP